MTQDWPMDVCEHYPLNSVTSVTLGELISDGYIDWDDGTWDFPKYSDEQDVGLKQKIEEHYWFRDISLIPVRVWKMEFLRTLREIMPKYILLYKLLETEPSLFGANSDYYKSRSIYSDFPQTSLRGASSDYASSGTDMEYERIHQESVLDIAKRLETYDDVDLMILKDLEPLFSCILSMNVNAF